MALEFVVGAPPVAAPSGNRKHQEGAASEGRPYNDVRPIIFPAKMKGERRVGSRDRELRLR